MNALSSAVDTAEEFDDDGPAVELPTITPLAPAALDQKNAAEAKLAELEGRTGRMILNRSQGQQGAAAALRDHLTAVELAKAELVLAEAAYGEALEQDGAARRRLVEAIRNMDPEDAIEGITVRKCCDRCGGDNGCLLLGGINHCAHPRKSGVPPQYSQDPVIRSFRAAAERELRAQENPIEEDEEYEDDDHE